MTGMAPQEIGEIVASGGGEQDQGTGALIVRIEYKVY